MREPTVCLGLQSLMAYGAAGCVVGAGSDSPAETDTGTNADTDSDSDTDETDTDETDTDETDTVGEACVGTWLTEDAMLIFLAGEESAILSDPFPGGAGGLAITCGEPGTDWVTVVSPELSCVQSPTWELQDGDEEVWTAVGWPGTFDRSTYVCTI